MKDAAEATSWTVVLRPDGVVDDVQGGAPFSWVGHALSALPEVPEALSRAAAGLRTAADGHWVRHGRVVCAVGRENVAVDLVVCHAVPLRRTHVIVRDMVLRVLDLFHLQAPDSGVDVHLEYADVVPVSFPAEARRSPGRSRRSSATPFVISSGSMSRTPSRGSASSSTTSSRPASS